MVVKRLMAFALVGVLWMPPSASPAVPLAVLAGVATSLTGSPLTQVDLDLVNLDNGKVTPMRTDGLGAFRAAVEPGLYTVDAGRSGYKVARGPRLVSLASGQAETTEIALASLQTGEPAQEEDRDRKPGALLLPPSRSAGFFSSKAGILTLSALGVGSIVAIVVLTRNDNKDNNASPSR